VTPLLGQLAALTTAGLWSTTALLFETAGKRVGSAVVNRTRLLFALLLLLSLHQGLRGAPLPLDAGLNRWGWLGLSAVLGLVVGDGALFQSYLLIGPRAAMLVMSTAPVWAALAAWPLFGETLAPRELMGVALALGGVAWVLAERGADERASDGLGPAVSLAALPLPSDASLAADPLAAAPPRQAATDGKSRSGGVRVATMAGRFAAWAGPRRWGGFLALVGALGQAGNLVTAKLGMAGGYPTLSATVARLFVATTLLWGWSAMRGDLSHIVGSWRDRVALRALLVGSVVGPVAGVWLSLVAVQAARVGIAATLMALPPVLLIPLERVVHGRRASRRAVAGTLLAFSGVAVLLVG
jgi:drug/metabolite transporter (DMT)-like permease